MHQNQGQVSAQQLFNQFQNPLALYVDPATGVLNVGNIALDRIVNPQDSIKKIAVFNSSTSTSFPDYTIFDNVYQDFGTSGQLVLGDFSYSKLTDTQIDVNSISGTKLADNTINITKIDEDGNNNVTLFIQGNTLQWGQLPTSLIDVSTGNANKALVCNAGGTALQFDWIDNGNIQDNTISVSKLDNEGLVSQLLLIDGAGIVQWGPLGTYTLPTLGSAYYVLRVNSLATAPEYSLLDNNSIDSGFTLALVNGRTQLNSTLNACYIDSSGNALGISNTVGNFAISANNGSFAISSSSASTTHTVQHSGTSFMSWFNSGTSYQQIRNGTSSAYQLFLNQGSYQLLQNTGSSYSRWSHEVANQDLNLRTTTSNSDIVLETQQIGCNVVADIYDGYLEVKSGRYGDNGMVQGCGSTTRLYLVSNLTFDTNLPGIEINSTGTNRSELYLYGTQLSSSGGSLIRFYDGSTFESYVGSTGIYVNISDRSVKKNIQQPTYSFEECVACCDNLTFVHYQRNDKLGDKVHFGFISNDVQKCPIYGQFTRTVREEPDLQRGRTAEQCRDLVFIEETNVLKMLCYQLRMRIQKLEQENTQLKSDIALIKARLGI